MLSTDVLKLLGIYNEATDSEGKRDTLTLIAKAIENPGLRQNRYGNTKAREREKKILMTTTSMVTHGTEKQICFVPSENSVTWEDFSRLAEEIHQEYVGLKVSLEDFEIGVIRLRWNPLLANLEATNDAELRLRTLIAEKAIPKCTDYWLQFNPQ